MQRCSAALPLNINPPFSFPPQQQTDAKNEVRLPCYCLRTRCRCGASTTRHYCISGLRCRFYLTPIRGWLDISLTAVNRIQTKCCIDSIAGTGCALTDYGCMCQNGGLFQLLVPCVSGACSSKADQQSEISLRVYAGPGGYKRPCSPTRRNRPGFSRDSTVLTAL